MNSISILNIGITDIEADCIVNGANEGLAAGSAIIIPGFDSGAKFIIHTVGPVWQGGSCGEAEKLMGCYRRSLELARENGCHSVVFPLVSTGAFGYPKREAWEKALKVCLDFLAQEDCGLDIIFAEPNESICELGKSIAAEMSL